jgi:hypothetical protein
MSLDIDWSLLSDPALTDGIVDAFNRYLATADRPSFLGPISVSSFDFGSRAPDVEVVGLGDVYPDFLADDEDDAGTEDGGESSQDGAGGRWQDGMSSAGGGRSGSRDWSQGGSHLAHYHRDGLRRLLGGGRSGPVVVQRCARSRPALVGRRRSLCVAPRRLPAALCQRLHQP